MRQAVLALCKSIHGRDGCRCSQTKAQYCDGLKNHIRGLFYGLDLTSEQIEALFEGRATIRMKPKRQ